ncbi:hypothetical protein MKZ38_006672 [Zalerion maritima]|uniref:Uncharacterized protein n=1 Tax=Zalerion maritima TaxID=339359 RepID=A0AAD5RVI7_9PEZI|nr:hypothetical protein MKZ38_006672 [Zalerion maritima]
MAQPYVEPPLKTPICILPIATSNASVRSTTTVPVISASAATYPFHYFLRRPWIFFGQKQVDAEGNFLVYEPPGNGEPAPYSKRNSSARKTSKVPASRPRGSRGRDRRACN